MEEKLKTMLSALESGALSASDKKFVKKEYLKCQGIELVTDTNCVNCWNDAINAILVSLKDNKIFMAAGCVIEFNGVYYNRHNITDAIALQIQALDPETEKYFFKK